MQLRVWGLEPGSRPAVQTNPVGRPAAASLQCHTLAFTMSNSMEDVQYLLDHDVPALISDVVKMLLAVKPADPLPFMRSYLMERQKCAGLQCSGCARAIVFANGQWTQ